MKKIIFLVSFFLIPFVSFSQLSENFNDGSFYGADRPVEWTGDTNKFTVNDDFQLQLNASNADTLAQLTTALDFSRNMQWEWWMKMDYSPSETDYVNVFLCCDEDSLTGDPNGLFVRIGSADKNVCLMRAEKEHANDTLIKGAENRLSNSTVALRLKAVLDNEGNFSLYSKLDDESEYVLEGSCNISETYESIVFGIACYFSPGHSNGFYFDNFLVEELDPEPIPTPNSSLVEDFGDGLFYGIDRSVEWTGDTSKFTVNGDFQLQLDAPGDGSPAQLKTALDFSQNRQWEWWMKMDFSPTADNYVKVFLCSDTNSLIGDLNGLFVRIGHTDKNVCLMQAQKGKNNKTLIKGAVKRLDKPMVALRLKAVLDNDGNFNLYSKLDDENEYILEGSCNISETYESAVFGIVCYFIPSRNDDFYFDDFLAGEPEDEPEPEPEPEPESNPTPNSSLVEDFSDELFYGDNRSVEWTGDTSKFTVNGNFQLQLDAPGDGSPAQLKTALDFSPNRQWEWWMKMNLNPTAANYANVFLCSDEDSLTGKSNGLFVRIGYTGKNVCLMQAQKGKNNKTLIKGAENRLNNSMVALRLKAVLDNDGNFNLYSKLDGENEYVFEGSCNISETYESSVFGIVCYFSSTHGKDFYFDDFWVGEPEDEPAPNPEPKPNLTPNSSLVEDFSDGLFQGKNRSVEWTGDISKFAVNNALQLQLNAPGDGSPAQLKTALDFSPNRQWEWWMKMDFSPTAANYAKVFLCCDENNLTGKPNGLFVRIGYTNKNICLMQAQKEKNNKTLIKGAEKRLDKKTVALRLKAVLDNDGNFNLYSKLDDENEYVLEGSCNISETYESSIFGVVCYFSSTRGKDFYFDDFLVREPESDNSAPNPEPETDPEPGDIVINEILYDPPAGCAEYVEIYNNSDKIFDLRFLSFTTRKPSDGSLNTSYPLSGSETLFHPGDYLVITKSRDLVCPFFNCRPGSLFAELSIMPALANASGCAVIRDNKTGAVIDEFAYNAGMHTIGSGNKKGISLERSDFNRPANSADNWYSASAESGFGTPGYQNSQKTDQTGIEKISIVYPQFSADNYSIRYQLDKSGYHCRALIYDVTGKTVNTIADTELSGTEGRLLWNGKGSSGQPLVAGIYIVYIEVYNMDGDVQKFRKPVVVK
ncbi:MAG: lamin tail domain-containing protein [Dysgonamonadaceae bacterium]|jgi:hypothetical protein|nr:lamin tail domain-containing protein [Dysgonamonadaceae bacterium]